MPFLNRLRTDAYSPGGEILPGEFGLVQPLKYRIDDCDYHLEVPRGFITDFASIPRPVRALPGFNVNGPSRPAAVLHDWLYCMHGRVAVTDSQDYAVHMELTRKECDLLFHQGLVSLGERLDIAWAMYQGVRAGGWYYWNKRKDGIKPGDFLPESYFHEEDTLPCRNPQLA